MSVRESLTRSPETPGPSEGELSRLSLFAAADLNALAPLLRNCPVRSLAPGETLIAAGMPNRDLFVVLSGELGVHLGSPAADRVARVGAGETVGEVSLIDREPASAYVVAHQHTRVLALDEELLWILADSSHAVAFNLLRTLASRLRGGNEVIQQDRKALEHFKFHACVDGLTGLFNRFWLDKMLTRQMERSRREGQPLSLLLIDVDHFKDFNDAYGHVAGDYALRSVGACLRAVVRPTDLLGRYGGEEFAVMLPGARLSHALEIAERVRRAVADTAITYMDGRGLPSVTVSLGAAELWRDDVPEAFVERADRALYRAKKAGRNRVEG